jgi:hypothetical protein
MQHIGFRTATAVALILPALSLPAVVTPVAAQDRRGGGAAAAPHFSAPAAPAPHFSAPAAPAPVMPHIAAPVTPHFAPNIAATPHFNAPVRTATPHFNAPVRTATPHINGPVRSVTPNLVHPNTGLATRQQRIEERRIQQAHGNNPTNTNAAKITNGAKTTTATSNVTGPGKNTRTTTTATNPNLASLPNNQKGRNTTTGLATRSQIYQPGKRPVLRNQTFASLSPRNSATRALATSTFSGRLAQFRDRDRDRDRFERRRFRGFVIGWIGPVFWPYAYPDFIDYTFYPYADDTFWPYAYDDVYEGIFGPYAPGLSTTYVDLPAAAGGRRQAARLRSSIAGGSSQVCSDQAAGLTDWPIELIARQVNPTDAQRAALDELKNATVKAVQIMQAACPTELPSTPTGRLAAMRQRIEAMLQAVQVVRPALENFYQSLSDEQKERFNSLDTASAAPARNTRTARLQGPDLAQVCSTETTRASGLPSDRIEKLLNLNDTQRAALDELDNASMQAAQTLTASCPQDQALTPPGRVAAMEQRLNAMLQALNTVQPALAKFYNLLNDEQKARFDRLPRQA